MREQHVACVGLRVCVCVRMRRFVSLGSIRGIERRLLLLLLKSMFS